MNVFFKIKSRTKNYKVPLFFCLFFVVTNISAQVLPDRAFSKEGVDSKGVKDSLNSQSRASTSIKNLKNVN
ncbi:hypothetical protein, partial [Algibacter sp.]|uniref:hypothetical protein n=1 Tax=Algibacter sp. TaxID=1872428 RepID=UPI003C79222F